MITREQISQVVGHPVLDPTGKKIGDAKHMYLDDATGSPEWVTVKTGFFGNYETFVPTRSARLVQDHLEVPYDKDTIKGAPNVDVDSGGHLSVEEERHLYTYYGIEEAGAAGDEGAGTSDTAGTGMSGGEQAGAAAGAAGTGAAAGAMAGRSTAPDEQAPPAPSAMSGSEAGVGGGAAAGQFAPQGDAARGERSAPGDAAEAMMRSEEEMQVRVERHATSQARLRKFVEVEDVEETVPLRREEVRLEREPITDAERSAAPADSKINESEINESEQIVTLHEEEPIVDTHVVPKERVRMRVEEHVERKTVHGRVRKERIEADTSGSADAMDKGADDPGQGRDDDRFR